MDDFRLIYKILRILQKSMDCEEIDADILSPERLELSVPKWSRIMAMLLKEGYITGGETWIPQSVINKTRDYFKRS